MEEVESYFFDTYALFEAVHENKNYLRFTEEDFSIFTSKLNLMELYYTLLRIYGKERAEEAFEFFNKFCVKYNDEVVKEASEFRLNHYRRDLSYIDCIGYILAKKSGAKFLTGDEQFKDFDNVEFVK